MFTPAEASYLKSQLLARLATVAPDGTVQNSPVGFFLNEELKTFDIWGRRMGRTKKFANVATHPQVALVIDDLESGDSLDCPRIEIRGCAKPLRISIRLRRITAGGNKDPPQTRSSVGVWKRAGIYLTLGSCTSSQTKELLHERPLQARRESPLARSQGQARRLLSSRSSSGRAPGCGVMTVGLQQGHHRSVLLDADHDQVAQDWTATWRAGRWRVRRARSRPACNEPPPLEPGALRVRRAGSDFASSAAAEIRDPPHDQQRRSAELPRAQARACRRLGGRPPLRSRRSGTRRPRSLVLSRTSPVLSTKSPSMTIPGTLWQ